MKKILLSLLCLIGFVAAYATDASITFSTQGYGNGQEVTSVAVDDNITIVFDKGTNSNSPKYYNTGTAVRVYGGGTMEIKSSNPAVILNTVTITTDNSSNKIHNSSTVSKGTLDISTGVISDIDANSVKFTQGGTSGHVRIQTVAISYSVGETTQVSTPEITPAGGEITADTEISITCDTEDASIYYTINGEDPSTESTLYEAPFKLTSGATVKAIAVKDGLDNSSIASATFNFPIEAANIADFIEAASKNATTITGTVTVVAQHNNYLFIQDETGRIVVYGNVGKTYNNGDQLTGIKGTWSPYNGLPEMVPDATTFGTATAGAAVEPETLAVEELSIDNLLAYVKLEGVTISDVSNKNATITDETGSAPLYNSLGIDLVAGENLTIVGFISCYNTTMQIMPLTITSASGKEVVEAPVINPNGGTIAKDQTIEITCATEGASIYYTVNGEDPSAESTLYEGPFTLDEECTVKAIAVADDMENSAIVEAAFTFLSEDTNVATFNFTDPSSLNPAQEEPAFGQSAFVVLNDVELSAGNASVSFSKGSATTDCRIWAGNSAYDLRIYKGSTMTISVENGTLTSIVFEGADTGDTYMSADNGELTSKTWTAAEETSSVVFSISKNSKIDTITVTYEYDSTSAIEDIVVESDEAVEYFNLQGVKVANPENGLYIRKQGGKATKVLVK